VLLMPANSSPHKHSEQDPGAWERLRMCELAVAAQEGLQACAIELDREAPSYTVETLERLHEAHPDARFTFIAGADTVRTLPTWRRPAELLALTRLAVATREGSSREQVLLALAEVLGSEPSAQVLAPHVSFLEMPHVAVSSSQVRERVARGQPVDELVGGEVARYIDEHGLYRPAQQQAGVA
jgi:nicotinate-nucleotide adenylyltransferase